jgi:hypothetical protein
VFGSQSTCALSTLYLQQPLARSVQAAETVALSLLWVGNSESISKEIKVAVRQTDIPHLVINKHLPYIYALTCL